ncbi:amidohydrolase [Anaerotignum sp.]|uniref:amidohydrolase n=1 Tax=Anaerotignum sp. TaxID=2039241 RepID=UPI0028972252|nr:amidohydrolase family protein [Anaerotignum sp.]
MGCLGNERLKYGIMKIMIDGSSSSPSCAVSIPYCHDNGTGILSMLPEEVEEVALVIHKAGLQAAAHCIGDRAAEIWITAIEKAQKAFPREDSRHRIEHCGMANSDQIKRIKDLGMIPTPNTRFLYLNGERYFKFFGERANSLFPCKSWVDAGVKAAIGTDGPIVSSNPLLGLSSAIDRRTSVGNPIGPEQNITILEAIRMYTYNGAYATFEEDIKGSIEVGKLADLAVFNGDILESTASELEKIDCLLTMVDGEVVYHK